MPSPLRFLGWKAFERQMLQYQVPAGSIVLANDLTVAEAVLADREGNFPKSAHLEAMLRPLIGGGLFGQQGGSLVLRRRKTYLKVLSKVSDDQVARAATDLTNRYVQRWIRAGGDVTVPREMSRLTVDIVTSVVFGDRFSEQESLQFVDLFFEYHKRCNPSAVFCTPGDAVSEQRFIESSRLAELGGEMRGMMHRRFILPLRQALIAHAGSVDGLSPFVQALLDEQGQALPAALDELLLDEVSVMILAGHETTASVLSWLLWEISGQPSLLDDLRSAQAGSEAFSEALGALIQEGLRLYPPIAFYLRDVKKDTVFRGKSLPAGSSIAVSPWAIHRHKKVWPEAERFCPARWMKGIQKTEKYKLRFQPFGYGARFCPGKYFAEAELRVILSILLQGFDLERTGGRAPLPLGNLTSRPDYDFRLKFKPRGA